MKSVLIYFDEGVGLGSFQRLLQLFTEHLPDRYAVQAVNHHFLRTKGWEESAALLVFPGGRDLPYHLNLQGEGNARIQGYVQAGGRFLGICAGGYYGAAHVEFDKGGELEICGARELAFFPGKAIGPAYGRGLFRYDSESGARAAQIAWEKGVCAVYFNGGCWFEHAEKYASIQVIARYGDLPNSPAAALFCEVDEGAALLTGIHPEYAPGDPFSRYLINKILI
jgi:biotin---protein ligase